MIRDFSIFCTARKLKVHFVNIAWVEMHNNKRMNYAVGMRKSLASFTLWPKVMYEARMSYYIFGIRMRVYLYMRNQIHFRVFFN